MTKEAFDREYYSGKQFANEGKFSYEDNKKNSAFNHRIVRDMMAMVNQTPKTILDFGCSGGFFLRYCLEQAPERFAADGRQDLYRADGIEVSEFCRENHCLPDDDRRAKIVASFNELPRKQYDLITSWFVLEHIPGNELIEHLAEMAKISKWLLFRVPVLHCYETHSMRRSYDPDPTHCNVLHYDEWRRFLYDNTDWYMVNSHVSDFSHFEGTPFGRVGGPGPVATFLCTTLTGETDDHQEVSRIIEAFPPNLNL